VTVFDWDARENPEVTRNLRNLDVERKRCRKEWVPEGTGL